MNSLQIHTEETLSSIEGLPEAQYNELNKIITELIAAYPNANTSPLTVGLYMADLANLPLQEVKLAIRSLRVNSPYFPAVNEIYQEVASIREQHAKKVTEAQAAKDRVKRNSWQREGSTEVEQYLAALQHNIDQRKKKETPLVHARKLASLANDINKIAEIDVQLAEIRDDHQAIADLINYEFREGKEITYLKEIAGASTENIDYLPKSVPRTISNSNRDECQACFGSGWQHVYERVDNSEVRMRSKGVMPCSCELGAKFFTSYAKATGRN